MSRRNQIPAVSESLDDFQSISDHPGLSLDELSGSLAQLLGKGADPYAENAPAADAPEMATDGADEDEGRRRQDTDCPLSPRSILEAMLFVGHPANEPLTATHIAALMRGVRASEVDLLVEELNATYLEEGCPYAIRPVGVGYRLELTGEFESLREKFYGKVREAKLSQAAIDVLAVVAYHQPVDCAFVDKMRREESGRALSQLVRRELLTIERTDERPRRTLYRTTGRFLEFFGLQSLDELPQSQDFDRR